ncbi:MAG: hypothetical protein AABX34_00965, partial [Nanoarchaeota archaeon]
NKSNKWMDVIQQLKSGKYSLVLEQTFGGDEETMVSEEYFKAGLANSIKKLGSTTRQEAGEWVANFAAQIPEGSKWRAAYVKATIRTMMTHGILNVAERHTAEENRGLSFLEAYLSMTAKEVGEYLSKGDLKNAIYTYLNTVTAQFASLSIGAEGLRRTIVRLPELAGRRFMELHQETINAILPLNYHYFFLREDLVNTNYGNVSVSIHPDSLQPLTLGQMLLAMLKENGVSPLEATTKEKLELFRNRLEPVYHSNAELITKSLFNSVLTGSDHFKAIAGGNAELDTICSIVASQFDREEIAYLVRNHATKHLLVGAQELAHTKGYAFPKTAEDAQRLLSNPNPLKFYGVY